MIADIAPAPLHQHSVQQKTLRLGYLPLTDAAPLLVAHEKGFFARHGVQVELSCHTAWAALRDRIAGDALDGAQMLAPMPIALSLGLGGPRREMSVLATLSRNGNTIVLSQGFADAVLAQNESQNHTTRSQAFSAKAIAKTLVARRLAGLAPPVFAVVFPYSSHAYLLRHWLAAAGIDTEREIRLVALPPSQVVEHLAEDEIAGFCAGEPWGSRAVELGVGQIALPTSAIWPHHPEKVLAFPNLNDQRAGDRSAVIAATAALIAAGQWADDPANREETVRLLCRDALAGLPADLVSLMLNGNLVFEPWGAMQPVERLVFAEGTASYPARNQAEWYLQQMARWGHLPPESDPAGPDLSRIWRPDLWAQAAAQLGIDVPDLSGFGTPDDKNFAGAIA